MNRITLGRLQALWSERVLSSEAGVYKMNGTRRPEASLSSLSEDRSSVVWLEVMFDELEAETFTPVYTG